MLGATGMFSLQMSLANDFNTVNLPYHQDILVLYKHNDEQDK
jgi:hypothetical protein